MTSRLVDPELVAQVRLIEKASGSNDLLAGFIRQLERGIARFGEAFSDYVAQGDIYGAERAAHTLKGTCRQLGAMALGDLFAEIERSTKAGDYAEAKRKFDNGATLIAESLEALKHA
jgi:HPt (histidine-containing phosphotransfer) domain-containing protein